MLSGPVIRFIDADTANKKKGLGTVSFFTGIGLYLALLT